MTPFSSSSIVIATRNRGKVKEFAALFEEYGLQARSLDEFDDVPDIVEDGTTFMENAEKKARETAEALGLPVLADDSGLCVDALGGAPGVYSARYAGNGAGDEANNRKLLQELKAVRGSDDMMLSAARFVCTLALYDPVKSLWLRAEGECPGFIIAEPRGAGGFGYDPLFYLPELGRTMAELDPQEKNRISHRGQAIARLVEKIASLRTAPGKAGG